MSEQSILGTGRKELVPIAERPYGPSDEQETAEETVWANPTDQDVVLDLYVGIPPNLKRLVRMGKRLTWEQRTGKRRYIIRAKSERAIPSEFDMAIQHHECQEADCSQNKFACRDRTHRHLVVGGLAPHTLVMKQMQVRPVVSTLLDDTHRAAEEKRAKIADALIARSDNEVQLQEAQAELRRLNEELARAKAQIGSVSPDVEQGATRSTQAGISAAESRVAALEERRPKRSEVIKNGNE